MVIFSFSSLIHSGSDRITNFFPSGEEATSKRPRFDSFSALMPAIAIGLSNEPSGLIPIAFSVFFPASFEKSDLK